MTVQELVGILWYYSKDAEIILAVDEEGNNFHPIEEVGKILIDDNHDVTNLDEPEEAGPGAREVVVLWPGWWRR